MSWRKWIRRGAWTILGLLGLLACGGLGFWGWLAYRAGRCQGVQEQGAYWLMDEVIPPSGVEVVHAFVPPPSGWDGASVSALMRTGAGKEFNLSVRIEMPRFGAARVTRISVREAPPSSRRMPTSVDEAIKALTSKRRDEPEPEPPPAVQIPVEVFEQRQTLDLKKVIPAAFTPPEGQG